MTKPLKSAAAKSPVRDEIGPDTRLARLAEFLLGRPWPATVFLVLFAVVLLGPRLTPPWHLNHDVAWYCYVAGRVLDGAMPYVDVIDMNPPLAAYLCIPAAALARMLHGPDILVFNVYVCSLALVSLILSHAVLRRSAIFPRPALRRFLLAILIYVLVAAPGPAFGQREHFLVLALLPYLLAGASRAVGRPLGGPSLFVLGLLAGVGVSLKPYFLLAPLGPFRPNILL